MKIVLIGGHFSPAFSLIQKLKDDDILYIGRKYALEGDSSLSFEFRTLDSLGIKFIRINTGRFQRRLSRYTIPSLAKVPSGFFQSYKILRKFRPDIVVGFGGYLSVPVVLAAYLLKIPIVLHEQTLEAGFANKMLARFANKICISHASSFKYFSKQKTVLTGNPIRDEILQAKGVKLKENEIPLIYITGGSLGSHKINLLLEKTIEKMLNFANVIHQTGDAKNFRDFERLTDMKNKMNEKLKKRYQLFKFLSPDQVGEVLRDCNLVIARSGINTVSEIIYLAKPAIFIPLPFSQRNEQKKNAEMAKKLGIAEIFEENQSTQQFLELVKKMISNLDKYRDKNPSAQEEGASEKVIDVIRQTAKK
ncbi:MAG: hypothetical protein A2W22_03705 [Candidatus Levybacteria bacterium RBG_16_35_11]|nr:MAG: hypothetical protein A2W22_03705 [Candidatus Levybacteria bacterium RBG_16_35_11]